MNKKRILSLVLIFLGVIFIASGVIFTVFDNANQDPEVVPDALEPDDNSDNQVSEGNYELDRNYQTINQVEEEVVVEIKEDSFGKTTDDIGFSKNECVNNNCVASRNPYSNSEVEDIVVINYLDDGSVHSYGTFMYYYKDDYKLDVVVDDANRLINNYVGYSYTLEYFQTLDDKLNSVLSNSDLDDDVVIDRIYVGEYTLETIINKSDDFYLVKTFLIKTSDYM